MLFQHLHLANSQMPCPFRSYTYLSYFNCPLASAQSFHLQGVFGNIWISIFSHFKLMTLEQWVDICNLAMEAPWRNPVMFGCLVTSSYQFSYLVHSCSFSIQRYSEVNSQPVPTLGGESGLGRLLFIFHHPHEPDPGEPGHGSHHHGGGGTRAGRQLDLAAAFGRGSSFHEGHP